MVSNHCLLKKQRQVRLLCEDTCPRLPAGRVPQLSYSSLFSVLAGDHTLSDEDKSVSKRHTLASTRHLWISLVKAYHIWYDCIIRTACMRFKKKWIYKKLRGHFFSHPNFASSIDKIKEVGETSDTPICYTPLLAFLMEYFGFWWQLC